MDLRETTLALLKARQWRQKISPYKPLGDREIRLLRILPGNAGDPLKCSLVHYSLAEAQLTHVAVSYPWGPPEDPHHTCSVDGIDFIVRDNAFQILSRLRKPDETVPVWIDCLCINQKNKAEKSAQIQLMHSIYRDSDRTIIWLGQHKDATNEVADYIKSIDIDRIYTEFIRGWQGGSSHSNKSFILDMLQDHPRKEYLVNSMAQLFSAVYFTRVWIRQEAALGRNAFVLWGQHELSWKHLAVLAWIYRPRFTFGWPDWVNFDYGELEAAAETVLSINGFRIGQVFREMEDVHSVVGYPLYGQLVYSRSGLTTKAHDKVYALSSISGDLEHSDARLTKGLIKPNYNLSWQEVYVEAAKFLSAESNSGKWQFLKSAGLQFMGVNSDLPSWVPDWRYPVLPYFIDSATWASGGNRDYVRTKISPLSKKQRSQVLSYKDYTTIARLCIPLPRDKCKVTETELYQVLEPKQLLPADFMCPDSSCKDKMSKAEYNYLESASRSAMVLDVLITMQDTITYVGQSSPWHIDHQLVQGRADFLVFDAENLKFLAAQVDAGRDLYITDETLQVAYDTTLIACQDAQSKPALPELIASASAWRKWFADDSIDHQNTKFSVPYHGAIESSFAFTKYAFAYTETGYMCLVPKFTRPGDKVVIIVGYPAPFVVRPTLQEWHMLIGTCYVHGMMQSKASELMDEFLVKVDEKTGETVIKRPQGDVRRNGLKMDAGRYVDILGTLGHRWLKLI